MLAAQDGLLLYSSFDQSLHADIARSEKTAVIPENARLVPGKIGQGYLQDGVGALKYQTAGNLKAQEGTVAMWVRPVNWNGADNRFHYFFSAGALQAGKRHLQLYKYYNGGLVWLVRNQEAGKTFSLAVTNSFRQWKAGEWHHLAVSWSRREKRCYLYVDGRRSEMAYPENVFPDAEEQLAPSFILNNVVQAPNHDAGDRTVIDEVYIFDRIIGDGGVADLMEKGTKIPAPRFTLPPAASVPVIDGKIGAGEYAGAWSSNVFVIAGRMGFEPRETRAFAAYDKENLYLAFQSRTKGGDQNIEIAAQYGKRDSEVYLDDAVEIMIKPPDGALTQIVVNSIGTVYDTQGGKMAWNGNYAIANIIEGNWWVCEIKIPFRELSVKPPSPGDIWKMNLARDWKNPTVFASLSDTQSFSDVNTMPDFVFGGSSDAVQSRLDLERIFVQTAKMKAEVRNLSPPAASYRLQFYSYDNQNTKVVLGENALTVASGKAGVVELSRDLTRINTSQLQNRIGIEIRRNDIVLQCGEYILKTFPPLTLSTGVIASRNALRYTIDITGLSRPLDEVRLECRLTRNGVVEKQWTLTSPKQRILESVIQLDQAKPGSGYTLYVAVKDSSDRIIAERSDEFRFPVQEAWNNTTAGLSERVPVPWTDMVYDGSTVKVWGREYRLNESGLPRSIISMDGELLASPVTLHLSGASGKINLDGMKFAYLERKATEARFRSERHGKDFDLTVTGLLEYDGFLWYDVELRPHGKLNINQFQLEIPVRKDAARFIMLNRSGSAYAELGTAEKLHGNQPFFQQILFCNDERGLAYFTESDEFYHPRAAASATELKPTADAEVLRINFIAGSTEVDRPLVYSFGLQAAPLKPLPNRWRDWLQSYRGKFNREATMTQIWSWSKWYGFLRPHTDDNFRKQIADIRRNIPSMRIQPYLCQYILSTLAPEYKVYAEEWMKKPKFELMEFGPKYPGISVVACLGSKSYRDFWLDSLDKFLKEYKVDGYYWDSIDPGSCQNEYHGHGYTDEKGERRATTDIRHYRAFYKRAYTMLKERFPDAIVTGHASQRRFLATVGFSDVVYDGEQFVSRVSGDPNYCHILDDDYTRAFFGKQFGLVPMLLPAYYNNEKEAMAGTTPTESIYLHALIYDFLVHSHRINNRITDDILSVTRRFGMGDARHIGPWNEELSQMLSLSPAGSDLRAAVYARQDKLLLVIGNFGGKPVDASLQLKSNRYLRSIPRQLTDLRAGKPIESDASGSFRLSVPPYNFLLLEAAQKP